MQRSHWSECRWGLIFNAQSTANVILRLNNKNHHVCSCHKRSAIHCRVKNTHRFMSNRTGRKWRWRIWDKGRQSFWQYGKHAKLYTYSDLSQAFYLFLFFKERLITGCLNFYVRGTPLLWSVLGPCSDQAQIRRRRIPSLGCVTLC